MAGPPCSLVRASPGERKGESRPLGSGVVVSVGHFSTSVRAAQRAGCLFRNFLAPWGFPWADGRTVLSDLRSSLGHLWDSCS